MQRGAKAELQKLSNKDRVIGMCWGLEVSGGTETWRQKYRECESRGKHSMFPPDEREAGRTDAVTGETDARRTLRSRGRGGGVSPGAAEVAPEQGVGDGVRL